VLLNVGAKTSGVLHVKGKKIVSYAVKAVNEFEKVTATVRMQLGKQVIEFAGDKAEYQG